jgi:hypothetical protein
MGSEKHPITVVKAVSPMDIIVKKSVTNPGSATLRQDLKKVAKWA